MEQPASNGGAAPGPGRAESGPSSGNEQDRPATIYLPAGDRVALYEGPIDATYRGAVHRVDGAIELELSPRLSLRVTLTGSDSWMHDAAQPPHEVGVSLPAAAGLDPPPRTPERADADPGGVSLNPTVNRLEAGDLTEVERVVLCVFGQVAKDLKRDLCMTVGDWTVRLRSVDDGEAEQAAMYWFVEAHPSALPATQKAVEQLQESLFFIFSLAASREVGVGPAVGLDKQDRVVWVDWAAPVYRPGTAGMGWYPTWRGEGALQALASGLARIQYDRALVDAARRAMRLLLVANGQEVLDVRVPIACTGLELLAWAVLQRQEGLTADSLRDLSAGEQCRRLLEWAGVPVEIPDHLSALQARHERLDLPAWAGPEVLFNVRNKLVHPPKHIDQAEWPEAELFDAWQLATWYLELALLRLLDYRGAYWNRLRPGRWEWECEPVPWMAHPENQTPGVE